MKTLVAVYTPRPVDFKKICVECARFCRAAVLDDEVILNRGDGYAAFYVDNYILFELEDEEIDLLENMISDPYFYGIEFDDQELFDDLLHVIAQVPGCVLASDFCALLPAAEALEMSKRGEEWLYRDLSE